MVSLANVLRRQPRSTDVIGRLGGDEFGVMLPYATREQAEEMAASLLDAVRSEATVLTGSHRRKVTTSIGVAMFDEHDPERCRHFGQRRSRHVRRQGGWTRPVRDPRNRGDPAVDPRSPRLGRPDHRCPRPGQVHPVRPTDHASRLAEDHTPRTPAQDDRRGRTDHQSGDVPRCCREVRIDQPHRPLGRRSRDRCPGRPCRPQAVLRGEPVRSLDGRRRLPGVHRAAPRRVAGRRPVPTHLRSHRDRGRRQPQHAPASSPTG